MTRKKKFIQKVFKRRKVGVLHRQLGIPVDETIPMELLERIKSEPVGNDVEPHYYRRKAKYKVKVTHLLKKRANFLLNIDRLHK